MKKNINPRVIWIYIYAFIVIYFPNLSYYIKINAFILFGITTMLALFINLTTRKNKIYKYLKMKPIIMFIVLNILFTVYYAIRTMIAGTDVTDFHNLRTIQNLMPILILIGVLLVYCELNELNYDKNKKYKFIINIATIQGIISIAMIAIPGFRNVAYNITYNGSTEVNEYILRSRLYGICDGNYTYSLQVLSSFLATFALYYAIFYKEKKYVINSLIIFSTTLLNGRFGIIIYGVMVLVLIVYVAFIQQKLIKAISLILAVTVLTCVVYVLIEQFAPNTMLIIKHAIDDVISTKEYGKEDTETRALLKGIVFPERETDWIFGTGYRIYGRAGTKFQDFRASDIGFINDLFMVGIFSFLFLYGGYLYIARVIIKKYNKREFERVMTYSLILCVVLSNIKGEVFRSQTQIATILIILIFMVMESIKNDKIHSNNTNV